MSDDEEVLADYAKSKKERELIRNVASMLDEYEHNGYRSTYGKFKDLIEGFSIEKSLKGGVRTTWRNIQRTRLEAAKTLANRSVLSAPSFS